MTKAQRQDYLIPYLRAAAAHGGGRKGEKGESRFISRVSLPFSGSTFFGLKVGANVPRNPSLAAVSACQAGPPKGSKHPSPCEIDVSAHQVQGALRRGAGL
jgi:hypothetical protein